MRRRGSIEMSSTSYDIFNLGQIPDKFNEIPRVVRLIRCPEWIPAVAVATSVRLARNDYRPIRSVRVRSVFKACGTQG